jgi:hypothetical protein
MIEDTYSGYFEPDEDGVGLLFKDGNGVPDDINLSWKDVLKLRDDLNKAIETKYGPNDPSNRKYFVKKRR